MEKNKYLEALDLVKRTCEIYIDTTRFLKGSDIIANQINEALNIIQNRLEAIDNAKPSEALEWLEHTGEQWVEKGLNDDVVQYKETQSYREIKQALIKAQEQGKALKIVFEKRVNIEYLRQSYNVREYNSKITIIVNGVKYAKSDARKLTEKEFDTLKRYCK